MDNQPTAVFPLCAHIKGNGVQCASPALRGMRFCFQHLGGTTSSLLRARATIVNNARLDLAYPADRESIQYNLSLVAQALADGRIDSSIANTYIRLYRVCEQNLHHWEKTHKGQTAMPAPQPDRAGAPDLKETREKTAPSPADVSQPDNNVGAPCLEETWEDVGAPCLEETWEEDRIEAQPSATADRPTPTPISEEEMRRRTRILLKHQDRIDKLTQEYQDYPNCTQILTSAMIDILEEESPEKLPAPHSTEA